MFRLPWCCGGDFNAFLGLREKKGGSDVYYRGIQEFRACIDDCGLWDVGFSGDLFTWDNDRGGDQNVLECLDHILANDDRANILPIYCVSHLNY